MVDFNKIISAIKSANRSSEILAREIGVSATGLRKTIKNETITLIVYEKLAKALKIHPCFVFDKQGDTKDYFYKKSPEELQLSFREVEKLHHEIKTLKELNSKLQSRLLDVLDDRKKSRN